MKMQIRLKSYIGFFTYMLIIVLASSCKKFVEIDPPKNQLINRTVFETNETANAAMLGIYAEMGIGGGINSYQISVLTGLSSDELTSNSPTFQNAYINSISPVANFEADGMWKAGYKLIYLTNGVIEGCNLATALNPVLKKQLIAESQFIRAFAYFNLVNLFGDLPLVLSTDYTKTKNLARSPITKIYEQIISDLLAAEGNLNASYIGMDGFAFSTERIRPNQAAAAAMLARVYLYAGNYNDAERLATKVIEATADYDLVELNDVFLKNNTEAIWQMQMNTNSAVNTYEGQNFIPENNPINEGKPTMSSQQLDAFEQGDGRFSSWVGKIQVDGQDYYYPYKYKIRLGDNATAIEYSCYIRLAELYLIRAEARNELNNSNGAISDLNILRSRARATATPEIPKPLPALETALSKEDVRIAILHERQAELFTEGHRWYDLKRTGNVDNVMKGVTPLKGGGTWSSYKKLWPILEAEILNNRNLEQNEGYN